MRKTNCRWYIKNSDWDNHICQALNILILNTHIYVELDYFQYKYWINFMENNEMEFDYQFNIMLVGDKQVGKSYIFASYFNGIV